MSNPNPNPATRFKPGQSGNPTGKRKGLFTADQMREKASDFFQMTRQELEKIVKDPQAAALDSAVANILLQSIRQGDYSRLESLLNRTIGKVKDQLEVSTPKPYIIERLGGGEIELGARIEGELIEADRID